MRVLRRRNRPHTACGPLVLAILSHSRTAPSKLRLNCGVSALFTDFKDGLRLEQKDDVWEKEGSWSPPTRVSGRTPLMNEPMADSSLAERVQRQKADNTSRPAGEQLRQEVVGPAGTAQIFRNLIDALPDFIFVKDDQGRFITVNQSLLSALGAGSNDEVAGKTDYDFHMADMAKRFADDDRSVMASGEALISREETHSDATGVYDQSTAEEPRGGSAGPYRNLARRHVAKENSSGVD